MSDQIMLLSDHKFKMSDQTFNPFWQYFSNKSFLINKLQYSKYRFLQKHLYRKTLQKYNSESFVFTSSPANKQKKKSTEYKIIFSISEQFLLPLKEAGMKVFIPDLSEKWYELVEYAKKTFSRRSFVSSHMA